MKKRYDTKFISMNLENIKTDISKMKLKYHIKRKQEIFL